MSALDDWKRALDDWKRDWEFTSAQELADLNLCSNATIHLVVAEDGKFSWKRTMDEEDVTLASYAATDELWERMRECFGPRMRSSKLARGKHMYWPLRNRAGELVVIGHVERELRVWSHYAGNAPAEFVDSLVTLVNALCV